MGMQTGSVLIRRQLGRRLQTLRADAGRTHEDVARARIASRSTISRIEAGKGVTKIGTLMELARFYQADHETTEALIALGEGARMDGWWEESAAAWPEWLGIYIGLESAAATIEAYEPGTVHGLLQTEAYARELIATNRDLTPDVVDQRARFRVERRHAVLDRPDPARLDVVLGEAALLMNVGGDEVMAQQRQVLLELARRPEVTVSVIPVAATPLTSPGAAFAVLDFADPDDPDVAYIEHYVGAKYMEQSAQVTEHRRVFGLLRESSIPIEEHLK